MKSSTATDRLSAPMSKRTTFTSITPLPPHITRAAIVEFLHNYETMIDINPLVTDRYRIPPPADADPDELHCVWYQLTDAVVMPWSGSQPTPADNSAAKQKSGNVSYTCAFHPLPDGLQTHCRAPLGVDIRDRWTVGGTEPGEPRQPVELGLASLGAPATGLYLREDVDLRCNRLMSGFVKKTLKKSHESVVQKLNSDLSSAASVKSPVEQRVRSSSNGSIKAQPAISVITSTTQKQRPVSMGSPLHSQRPTPYRVYPGKERPSPPVQQLKLQSPTEWKPQQQQQQQEQQQTLPRTRVSPELPSYLRPQNRQYQPQQSQQKQPMQPYRQHQYAHSYTHNLPSQTSMAAPAPAPPSITRKDIPSALAIGPPPSVQQQARQAQLQNQQQYQQNQRLLHPFSPQAHTQSQPQQVQPKVSSENILVDISSLSLSSSSSPAMSYSSLPTPDLASSPATVASTPAQSPPPQMLPSPPTVPLDRFRMSASPLTRLQLQLPKVTTDFSNGASSNIVQQEPTFAEKEQRHSLYQQLMPPLVFSAREVVASEPRRKSTESDVKSFGGIGAGSGISGLDDLPLHDLSLCPQPLRIGGNRRASAEQVPQTQQEVFKPFEPVAPVLSAAPVPVAIVPATPLDSAQPASTTTTGSAADPMAGFEYPAMNPYEYNEDDYEDIYVDSPVMTMDGRAQNKGPYSPTVFAEMDGSASASVMPEWKKRRLYLAGDLD